MNFGEGKEKGDKTPNSPAKLPPQTQENTQMATPLPRSSVRAMFIHWKWNSMIETYTLLNKRTLELQND